MTKSPCFIAPLFALALSAISGGSVYAQTADLILYNGKIVTVDARFSIAQAIAVSSNRILATGTNQEMRKLAGPGGRQIDLAGKMVTPGFVDGHPHMFNMPAVTLTTVKSIRDIQSVIAAEAARRKPGDWIILDPPGEPPFFIHMPEALAEGHLPDRRDLDSAAPNNPVWIQGSSFATKQIAVFNSKALAALGITKDSGPIPAVEVARDAAGEPTGQVIGDLSYFGKSPLKFKLYAVQPRLSTDQRVAQMRRNMATFNADGITAIYEGHGFSEIEIATYNEVWQRGESTVRSFIVKQIDSARRLPDIERQMDSYAAFRGKGIGDDMFHVGGIALIFGDNVGFGAGFMKEEYIGPEGKLWHGLQDVDDEKVYQISRAAAERNLRMNIQASGDRAIDIVLGALDRLNKEIPIASRRFVLEHCQFPSAQNIKDVLRLGIIPTTVTNFLWGQGNAYLRFYGDAKIQRAVPLKSWLAAGVPVALSTDYGPHNAMFTLWQTIARENGWTGKRFSQDESISREDAIRIYTINAARLMYWEDRIGSLEKGKLADLVVIDRDILSVPLNQMRDAKILATLVDGKFVHGKL